MSAIFLIFTILIPVPGFVYLIFLLFSYVRFYIHPLRKTLPGAKWLTHPITGQVAVHMENKCTYIAEVRINLKRYGSIWRDNIHYGETRVVIADPEAAKHILVRNASKYSRGSYAGVETMHTAVGASNILMASGELHKRLRSIGSPGFRRQILEASKDKVLSTATSLVTKWQSNFPKNGNFQDIELPIKRDFMYYTLECLGEIAMDHKFNCMNSLSPTADSMIRFFTTSTHSLIGLIPMHKEMLLLLRKLICSKVTLSFLATPISGISLYEIQKQFRFVLSLVKKGRSILWDNHRMPETMRKPNATDKRHVLLYDMLQRSDAGTVGDSEVMELLMAFLFAGSETSANALCWTLWLIAGNPDVQRKLAEECILYLEKYEASSQTDDSSLFLWDHVVGDKELTLCKQVIKESMRLYPPVPYVSRRTLEDDVVLGYKIPAGTDILISIAGLHHNPEVWGQDVEDFIPERSFSDDSFIPYGAGNHRCIGYQLANMELIIAITVLLSKLSFQRLDGDETVERAVVTMSPAPPVTLKIRIREHQ